MEHEPPLGNLLHLGLFLAGAAVIGVVALAVVERLVGGDSPPRIGIRHVLIAVGALALVVGAELLYHAVGGS